MDNIINNDVDNVNVDNTKIRYNPVNNIEKNNIFWTDDLTVLYSNDKFLQFIPTNNMTRAEQLNAVTRFCIYFIIIIYMCGKNALWFQIPIIIILFIVVLHKIFEYDIIGKMAELKRQNVHNNKAKENYNKISLESGFIDSDNNMQMGELLEPDTINKKKSIKYNYDKNKEYKTATCRMPTSDNPMMNPTLNDTLIYNPPIACNSDDNDISKDNLDKQISDSFNQDLYRDVSDLFETKNSQRQFYTVPQSNPPNTVDFAKWLYGNMPSCKSSQSACYKYEDLRYKTELL